MRIFNLISAWLLWLICGFYALGGIFLRVFAPSPRLETPPEKLAPFVMVIWIGFAILTAVSFCAYAVRRHFWFKRGRAAGLGFWAVSVFFYISVVFTTSSGFAPFFEGDRSSLQWASCLVGFVFLALGFPRVPVVAAPAPTPPPLPATTRPPQSIW